MDGGTELHAFTIAGVAQAAQNAAAHHEPERAAGEIGALAVDAQAMQNQASGKVEK